jgi:hypothetical protein
MRILIRRWFIQNTDGFILHHHVQKSEPSALAIGGFMFCVGLTFKIDKPKDF